MKNWYTITNKASGPAEISIFGPIGNTWDGEGVTAAKFIKDFKAIKSDDVMLTVNSPGGSLFDGLAIYTAMAASGKNITAKVMGLAASAASLLVMAAKRIEMPKNTHLMIHKAGNVTFGNADDMRAMASVLDSLDASIAATYAARSGKPEDEIKAMLDKGDTWLTADEAVKLGFADEATELVKVTAEFDMAELPEAVRASLQPEPAPASQPVVSASLAAQIEVLAKAAGLEAFTAVFALDPTIKDAVSAQAAITAAGEIQQYAKLANQAERAEPLIRARKSVDEARAILMSNEAKVDESTYIDTAPPVKPTPKPAEPFSTTTLWTQINANKAGSKK
jgi:ATP-dependent Clp endopeptidase proteolytic subunit ClpP